MIRIEPVKEITEELITALGRLQQQLSARASMPTRHELEQIIASPQTILFIARDKELGDAIVGTAAVVMYRTLNGLHAWIEDVVVDESSRGKGFGAALTQACIQAAASAGAHGVNLTSRPTREAANRLYRRMGFTQRETNVFYYPLNHPS